MRSSTGDSPPCPGGNPMYNNIIESHMCCNCISTAACRKQAGPRQLCARGMRSYADAAARSRQLRSHQCSATASGVCGPAGPLAHETLCELVEILCKQQTNRCPVLRGHESAHDRCKMCASTGYISLYVQQASSNSAARQQSVHILAINQLPDKNLFDHHGSRVHAGF